MPEKNLEARLQRIEDIRAIKNLVASYSYYYAAGMYDNLIALFACKTPKAQITISNWGTWRESAGIKRYYAFMKERAGDRKGLLSQHCFTVPVIEVAGDGETATSLWVGPGVAAAAHCGDTSPTAVWNWAKVGIVFVREDGEWKILRFHLYELVQFPFEGGMIDVTPPPKPDIPEQYLPDIPDTKDYQYSKQSGPVYIPIPPAPYEHYVEDETY